MKKYVKAASSLKPYLVTFGWDSGGPESGPIYGKGEDIVYALSEDDACNKWESENLGQFNSGSAYEGCWARIATQEEVDEFEAEMKRLEDEYQYMKEMGWIDDSDIEGCYVNSSSSTNYTVVVGDVEEYEIRANSEEQAIQKFLQNYATPEDWEEYEEDPHYIWVK